MESELMESMKDKIMQLLNVTSIPVLDARGLMLRDKFEKQIKAGKFYSDVNGGRKEDIILEPHGNMLKMKFDYNDDLLDEDVGSTIFHYRFIDENPTVPYDQIELDVFNYDYETGADFEMFGRHIMTKEEVESGNRLQIKLHTDFMIKSMMEDRAIYIKIKVVKRKFSGERMLRFDATTFNTSVSADTSFIQVKRISDTKEVKERRSTTPRCNKNFSGNTCCLDSLELDFSKYNMSFIAYPKKVQIHYCSGQCVYADDRQEMEKPKLREGSCCYPTELGGITINYLADKQGTTVQKFLPRLIAKTCGCH
uniref:TGF_BETA_2 domain-containing protein n=1 Tax=Rhabditophanes sp. KR3021 TaxID=114890 RepID=A0AC35TKF6_9BILA